MQVVRKAGGIDRIASNKQENGKSVVNASAQAWRCAERTARKSLAYDELDVLAVLFWS
jgi:hypothetical protein